MCVDSALVRHLVPSVATLLEDQRLEIRVYLVYLEAVVWSSPCNHVLVACELGLAGDGVEWEAPQGRPQAASVPSVFPCGGKAEVCSTTLTWGETRAGQRTAGINVKRGKPREGRPQRPVPVNLNPQVATQSRPSKVDERPGKGSEILPDTEQGNLLPTWAPLLPMQ
jgi:hypothetical protein